MLQQRNIAFFIDIDNTSMNYDNYSNVMQQLQSMGSIMYGKLYGVTERRHKSIIADAISKGYHTEHVMRVKRRGRKEFDSRICVDIADLLAKSTGIDAICIIAHSVDMVYLYSYIHARGIKIIACDDGDDESNAFVDEIVDTGKLIELKFNTESKKKSSKSATQPAVEKVIEQASIAHKTIEDNAEQIAPVEPVIEQKQTEGIDKTDELLREIEHLRALAESQRVSQTTAEVEPVAEPEPEVLEQSVAEQVGDENDISQSILDEMLALESKLSELQQEEQQLEQSEIAEQTQPEQQTGEASEPVVEEQPRATYVPQDDSELIRKIEEIRRNSQGTDSDELIDEIRKLLDGLE